MQVLTRPCPARAAHRVRCAPACAEQGCDMQTTAKFGLELPCLLHRLLVAYMLRKHSGLSEARSAELLRTF